MAKFSDTYKRTEYESSDTPLLQRSRSMRSSFRFIANRASMKRSTNNQPFTQNCNYKHLLTVSNIKTFTNDQYKQQQKFQFNLSSKENQNDLITTKDDWNLPNLPSSIPPKAAKILNIQPIPLNDNNQLNQEIKWHHNQHSSDAAELINRHHNQQHQQYKQKQDNKKVIVKNQINFNKGNFLNDNEIKKFENINLNSITNGTRSRSEERCSSVNLSSKLKTEVNIMPPPMPPPRKISKDVDGVVSNGKLIKHNLRDSSRKIFIFIYIFFFS